jgi:hypothetical protein
MYLRARREKQRKVVKFKTGLEGHIPSYMDLVSITHPMLRVGYAGLVLDYDSGTRVVTLSDAVRFEAGKTHQLAFRGPDGAILGTPFTVTEGATANQVILGGVTVPDLYFEDNSSPPFFAFGIEDLWSFLGKVVAVEPEDGEQVQITVLNYAPDTYRYLDAAIDELEEVDYITTPPVPEISYVLLSHKFTLFSGEGKATWAAAPGAISYFVEVSTDEGATWTSVGATSSTFMELDILLGYNRVRVSAVGSGGNGSWTLSNTLIGMVTLPSAVLTEDGTPETDEDGTPAVDEDYTP